MLLIFLSVSYFWTVTGDSLFRGEPEGTIISSDSVYMGNSIEELTEVGEGFISDIEMLEEYLYYSVSDAGLILRRDNEGSIDTIYRGEGGLIKLGVYRGRVVAGLSPGGRIIFIDGNRITDSLMIDAENIYSIEQWNDGLIIGSGPEGEIFRISEDFEVEEFYETDASSVTALDFFEGSLFASTSNPGLVYQINEINDGRIYYDAGLEDINSLGFVGDTLCISGISNSSGTPSGVVKFLVRNREFTPYQGTTILSGAVVSNKFYAGESEDGQIAEFHRKGFRLIADFDESQITFMCGIENNLFVGTGYPAKIYRMSDKVNDAGSYISGVFNGGLGVTWGNLFYEGEGDIDFMLRSGRKKEVDSSWTVWNEIERYIKTEDPFIQWKAILRGTDSYLREVRISYSERNSPPEFENFMVLPPTIGAGGMKDGPQHRDFIQPEQKVKIRKMGYNIPEQSYRLPDGIRCIYWEINDPDNDRIVSSLYLKRDGEEFRELASDITDNAYFLNTIPYPDGEYKVKIQSRDIPDSPDYRTIEKTMSFIIDQSPPEVTNIKQFAIGDSISISGSVSDKFSPVSGIYYNTPENNPGDPAGWRSAYTVDGILDERNESFAIKVNKTVKYVAIRVVDRHNNDKVIRIGL